MALRLTRRIGRWLRSEGHGLVDALEDRRLLLRQHLRDAELALMQQRARVRALEGEARSRSEEVERRRTQLASLDGDVDLALATGKEDLARYAAARLLPLRSGLAELEQRIARIEKTRDDLARKLARQEQDFCELRRRVHEELARIAEDGAPPPSPLLAADEEVELELLRRRAAAEAG